VNDDLGDDDTGVKLVADGPGLTLEQRSTRAVEEVRRAADTLEPRADSWKLALRDVHSHIFGDQVSSLDDATSTALIDAYRRLYDEMLRLSTLLDPDLGDVPPADHVRSGSG